MGELESVQELLLQLRNGEADALVRLLVLLVDQPLYLQAQLRSSPGKNAEANTLAIRSIPDGDKQVVPVYTSQAAAVDDTMDAIVVALTGAELAASLPKDRWLRFDTGSRHEVLLPPRALALLGQSESLQLLLAMSEPVGSVEPAPSKPLPTPTAGLPSAEPAQVVQDLDAVFRQFPEIQEAYYVETTDETGGPVVGLLTSAISVERRFELISQLADVSRRHFEEAGAIEVYDDLHSRSSHSWTLFNAQTPIFFRSKDESPTEEGERVEALPLNRQIGVQRVRERSGTERVPTPRFSPDSAQLGSSSSLLKERYDRSPTERIDRQSYLDSLVERTPEPNPYTESLFEAPESSAEEGYDETPPTGEDHEGGGPGGRLGRFIAGLRARR